MCANPPTTPSVKGVKGVNSMAVSKWAPPPLFMV